MSKCRIGRGGVGGQRAATEHARSRTACCSVGDEGRRRSGGAAARPAASPAMRTARPAGLPRASGRAASGPAPLLRRRSPAAAPPARSARLPRRAKYCCAPITDRRFLLAYRRMASACSACLSCCVTLFTETKCAKVPHRVVGHNLLRRRPRPTAARGGRSAVMSAAPQSAVLHAPSPD